jgi:RHS repeat-associated protein
VREGCGSTPGSGSDNLYLQYTNDVLKHRYLHGPLVDQALLDEDLGNGMTKWLLSDHEQSVRDVYELSFGPMNHKAYDSFGRVIYEQDTQAIVDTIFGYSGREFDDETGSQYNRARYYNPATGRFLSQDPSGVEASGDYNLYRYAGNNPLNASDPTGLRTFLLVSAGRRNFEF